MSYYFIRDNVVDEKHVSSTHIREISTHLLDKKGLFGLSISLCYRAIPFLSSRFQI